MIRKIIRRTSPIKHTVITDPDDLITDTIIDIIEKEGWVIFSPEPPPEISARITSRVYQGDNTEIVRVRCSQRDFRAVSRWLASLGLWDPVRTFPHQSEAD